ncbi:MAG: hypothetical protein CML68_05525 [Rhodobacteraceae bacterium]|nr:hypothetical protein [Paracoccaceae bacterium]
MTRRIPRSRLAGCAALLLAAGAHATALVRNEPPEAQTEGGAGAAVAALGSAFEDMTTGRESPVEAEELPPEEAVEPTPPEPPQETTETPEPPVTDRAEPAQTPSAPADTASDAAPVDPTPPSPVEPIQQAPVQSEAAPTEVTPQAQAPGLVAMAPSAGLAVAPLDTPTPQDPVEPPSLTALPVTPTEPLDHQTPEATPPEPLTPEAPQPETPQAAEPVQPTEPATTAALTPVDPTTPDNPDPDSSAPLISRKPPNRPDSIRPPEPEPAPAPRQQAQPAPKAPAKPSAPAAPQGNANQNTRKGTETGSASATAARQASSNAKSSQAGNAALSNYRGNVFRRIARAKRGRVNIKGATLVSLTISPSGQLAGVSVARSSGSGKLDQIAVAQVRRAAPFPATPDGRSQSYTVKISGAK